MAQNSNLASTNSLGDLVPVLQSSNGSAHAERSVLLSLLDQLHAKSSASAYKNWQVDTGKPPLAGREGMWEPAHTCVVQLQDKTIGVLKVAANGGCTLFVRLNRPHASQMADRDNVPRDVPRTFRRPLTIAQTAGVLRGARPFCLKEGEVHHPHALSLLCSMTRAGWLAMDTKPGYAIVVPSCTLVALTPLPRNFEQCLVLMGWKAAYTTAKEALWTAQAVDRSVWGETHADMFVGDVASKFAEAARELAACADPAVFTQHIPQLNSKSRAGGRALDPVQNFLLTAKAFSTIQPPQVASPAAAGAPTVPVADASDDDDDDDEDKDRGDASEVDMAPSDEEDGAMAFTLPVRPPMSLPPRTSPASAPVPSPEPEPHPAPQPKARRRPTSSSQSRRLRAQRDDDSDTPERDEEREVAKQDAELQEVVSTDSESESDSDDDDDDDDDDNDDDKDSSESGSDSEDSQESNSDSEPLANKPIAKNNQHTPTTRTVTAAAPGAQRPSDAQWLVDFARPCCKHVELFQREHQALIAPERMALIDADLQALRKPDSVPALLGAALNLVANVVGVHRDAPPEDAVPLGAVGRKRVRELAIQATDFSELTLARVDGAVEAGRKMLEELEDLRKRGRAVLQGVENACAEAAPPEAAAGAEPPRA
jgi:hypothetical protein